ncbi:stage V sporulation protein AE [Brevibacillus ginsengisoli]|uniref:stage V sporulation protein AE n=1 Tax=Brevibacillus ginsengisoli TaxID=363854 RepID=UPI003CF8EEC9
MIYLWAFLVGGTICLIGQFLLDVVKLTPAHTMTALVVSGAILGGFELYDPLVKFAGAGASVPITSFGNALTHGALSELEQHGMIGIVTGMFEVTSAGISAALVFAFLAALLVRAKG